MKLSRATYRDQKDQEAAWSAKLIEGWWNGAETPLGLVAMELARKAFQDEQVVKIQIFEEYGEPGVRGFTARGEWFDFDEDHYLSVLARQWGCDAAVHRADFEDLPHVDLSVDPNNRRNYVTAYTVERHWGGPEEGGWYYDWHDFLDTVLVADLAEDQQEAHRQALAEKYENLANGVLRDPEGREVRVFFERYPGEFRSTVTPAYK